MNYLIYFIKNLPVDSESSQNVRQVSPAVLAAGYAHRLCDASDSIDAIDPSSSGIQMTAAQAQQFVSRILATGIFLAFACVRPAVAGVG